MSVYRPYRKLSNTMLHVRYTLCRRKIKLYRRKIKMYCPARGALTPSAHPGLHRPNHGPGCCTPRASQPLAKPGVPTHHAPGWGLGWGHHKAKRGTWPRRRRGARELGARATRGRGSRHSRRRCGSGDASGGGGAGRQAAQLPLRRRQPVVRLAHVLH